MKIGELGRHTGLAPSAIRYYERLGLLPAPDRTSGQRRYSDDAYHRVLLVRFASDMGFSLGEIKLFLNGLRDEAPIGARWKALANSKIKEVEATIRRARRLKSLLEHLLECRCLSLRICVQRLSLSPDMRLVGQRQPAQDRARRTNRGRPVRTSSERRGR
ncbi:MAG: MerR family transcriptional regulator [Betaproteobacteria bacterium]|jgi:DNA-binding transcriptional MerR regulator|nr:MAG: MerR family transcriptional regulator [Betaproteobacteria bacterium]